MRYSLACISDTGIVREYNEDNFAFFGKVMPIKHQVSDVYAADVVSDSPFAVGVFDGMGGEVAGEVASYAAAQALAQNANRDSWVVKDLLEAISVMDGAVCSERDKRRIQTMGTTVTLLVVDSGHAYIANVGDSPAILIKGEMLKVLSRAHTDKETLQQLGITDRRPGLTQFLGMSDGDVVPSPYITSFDLEPDSSILLASDGLTESVTEEEIVDIMSGSANASDKAVGLRNRALENGCSDNVTVLLCDIADSVQQSEGMSR